MLNQIPHQSRFYWLQEISGTSDYCRIHQINPLTSGDVRNFRLFQDISKKSSDFIWFRWLQKNLVTSADFTGFRRLRRILNISGDFNDFILEGVIFIRPIYSKKRDARLEGGFWGILEGSMVITFLATSQNEPFFQTIFKNSFFFNRPNP